MWARNSQMAAKVDDTNEILISFKTNMGEVLIQR